MMFRRMAMMSDSARKALTLLSIVAPVRPLIGPVRATVEVSARCNFSCLMCPFYSPLTDKKERSETAFMDMAVAARVFTSAAKMGAKIVSFSGRGEPLLHPDFAGIVRLTRSRGLRSEVFTNGSLLTRQRIEEIVDAGLDTLAVSLVSASPRGYAEAHPGAAPGTFEKVLDSIALLQRMKRQKGASTPAVDLRFIAIEGSHLQVGEMVNLGIHLGADSIHLTPLRNRSVGDIGTIALSRDEEKLTLDRLKDLTLETARAGLQVNLDELAVFHRFGPVSDRFSCYAGWFDARVSVDGTVAFCVRCDRSLGNMNERPLEDIWLDSDYMTLRNLARNPSERSRIGTCDCDRCCHFYSNWRIGRFLSMFGLAPKVDGVGNGHTPSTSPQHGETQPSRER